MRKQKTISSNTKAMCITLSGHITLEELRQCPEFFYLDDYLAQNVINTIQEFCSILVGQYHHLDSEDKNETKNH